MQFGIHSLLFRETFLISDLPLLDKCKRMGFDAVEIIPFDPENFPAREVKAAAGNLGLTINIGYGMPAECNAISPDPEVRKRGVEFSKRLVDLSQEAGAKILTGVVHCGWGYLSGKMRTEDEWRWGVESFRETATHAWENSEVLLGIEPVNRFESHFINTVSDAVRFIHDVAMPNVKVHLDTFHLIREEDNITAAVIEAGPHVGYVHACENQRGIPGTGLVPWVDFFRALRQIGYDGCVTVESFDPDMERIAKLCCIWRKLAESPEQLATEGLKFIREIHRQCYLAA